jgi:hypothetical protein
MKSIDMLGWILELSEGLDYRLEGRYIDPAKKVCEIISAILAPTYDRDGYPAADGMALYQAVGPLNWQFAWADFDYSRWLPYSLFHHELFDVNEYWINPASFASDWHFGFYYEGSNLRLIFWQVLRTGTHAERFRRRIWSVECGSVNLIDSIDGGALCLRFPPVQR